MTLTPDPDASRSRTRNRLHPWIWGFAAFLLLLPAMAMRFTNEVDWTASDFVVMGALLTIACGLYELATWLSANPYYRGAFAIAVVTGFVTVWVNLAVGMFGSENNVLNLMFGGVLLVAALGTLTARFRAGGMAWAMSATAFAQLLAAVSGLVVGTLIGTGEQGARESAYEAFLTACFALPWLVSAQLFRRAARQG